MERRQLLLEKVEKIGQLLRRMRVDGDEHSPARGRLSDLLGKVLLYQRSLPDGRAVDLEELQREGVFGPEEIAFIASHLVTYKPHPLSAFHAMDMFHMPTEEGGCVFMGPTGPPLKNYSVLLRDFQHVVEDFLQLPRPDDELLLHIELESEADGIGVSRDSISFTLESAAWRERLPRIREAAGELGLRANQDEEIQGSWILSFGVPREDAVQTSAAAIALLRNGCGFNDETWIIYSAGALDETKDPRTTN